MKMGKIAFYIYFLTFYTDSSLLNQVLIHFESGNILKIFLFQVNIMLENRQENYMKFFLSRLNVAPESVTMIGDNYKSDVINPMNLGLASYFKEYKHVTGSIVDKKELKNFV